MGVGGVLPRGATHVSEVLAEIDAKEKRDA